MRTGTALLDLIGDTHNLAPVEEFRWELLRALQRALAPVDWISLNDLGPDSGDVTVIADPVPPEDLLRHYVTYADQNPLTAHYLRTGNGRAMRISDLVTQDKLHALELYEHVYEPLGIEYQMSFGLPHGQRILAIAVSRRAPDFSDDERDLLETARPFLIQAYRNAVRYSGALAEPVRSELPQLGSLMALGLTRRQAEVLRLLCTGAGERDIACRLGISHRTVEKHLQHVYRQLDVDNRARAAAVAWATFDSVSPGR